MHLSKSGSMAKYITYSETYLEVNLFVMLALASYIHLRDSFMHVRYNIIINLLLPNGK